jgi:hypothetical protein
VEAGEGVTEELEHAEFGEFSCRPSRCSRAVTSYTTVPINGVTPPRASPRRPWPQPAPTVAWSKPCC